MEISQPTNISPKYLLNKAIVECDFMSSVNISNDFRNLHTKLFLKHNEEPVEKYILLLNVEHAIILKCHMRYTTFK